MRNDILTFKVGEDWIKGVDNIRQEVVTHSSDIFREQMLIEHVLMV